MTSESQEFDRYVVSAEWCSDNTSDIDLYCTAFHPGVAGPSLIQYWPNESVDMSVLIEAMLKHNREHHVSS